MAVLIDTSVTVNVRDFARVPGLSVRTPSPNR